MMGFLAATAYELRELARDRLRHNFVAERDGTAVGYTVAHLLDGPDDTYAVGERYADLYSLSVASHVRGAGIGTQLLDELDRRLDEIGTTNLKVTVMITNVDAIASISAVASFQFRRDVGVLLLESGDLADRQGPLSTGGARESIASYRRCLIWVGTWKMTVSPNLRW